MKTRTLIATVAAGLLVAGVVAAQPYGMGPGMMWGGPGVGGGAGAGPMWGHGGGFGWGYANLNLSDDQLRKMEEIRQATRKAMFETQLQARRQMEAVLTPEQREQLRRRP